MAAAGARGSGDGMRGGRVAGRKLEWRIGVAAGALALAGAGIAVAVQSAAGPRRPPGAGCSDVTVIGARGSGQSFSAGGQFGGYGPEVSKAVAVIEGYLHAKGKSYRAEPVRYPAISVNVLKPTLTDVIDRNDYVKNHLDPFASSIAAGVNATVSDARRAQQACHDSKIVMVGYSQGAMVMHQAELALRTRDPAVFSHIVGTLLVADGNRVADSRAAGFGTSPAAGEGVADWALNALSQSQPVADVPLPGSTASVCNENDIVCDASLPALLQFSSSAAVHTSSYANCGPAAQCSYGPALINGAAWVGKTAASAA
jgi:cutinase